MADGGAGYDSVQLPYTGGAPGVYVGAVTATDPDGYTDNDPVTSCSFSVTVHDHSAAAFADGTSTLDLSFGSVAQNSAAAGLEYAIRNLLGNLRVNLGFDSQVGTTDTTGRFNVTPPTGTDLATGAQRDPYAVSINTEQAGIFDVTYTFAGFWTRFWTRILRDAAAYVRIAVARGGGWTRG
ncbi:MAG: hypothetical protein PHU85_07385 [Phycisphaerae bacterium]|nr:hypothetical protein [Phycisphaerae bacterium]